MSTPSTPPDDLNMRTALTLPWSRTERRVPRLLIRPLQEFLATEASGGIVLLIAAVAAIVWANTAAGSYEAVWHTEVTVGLGRWVISEDLRHWINDGAMAVFFFVVGLEIKRELISGELRDRRAAALPAFAAAGGMVVPALVYLGIASSDGVSRGWGIPMATDIAFAVGVLAIVGRGLPPGLRLFLLTLAIVDDIGAIVVIAIFYSGAISFTALGVAVGLLGVMVFLRRLQMRPGVLYLLLAIGVWIAVFQSGVHATIAGVALAFATPAVALQRPRAVSDEANRIAEETSDEPVPPDVDAPQWLRLASLSREAVSPLAHLERTLHPWTSFVIVPLFALANTGVRIGGHALRDATTFRVVAGVFAGLVVGKLIGVALGAFIATKIRVGRLPAGASWVHVIGVASVSGVGFTVSLFIASLAFTDPAMLNASRLGVVAGSVLSSVTGSVILTRVSQRG